jgi:uncharacterized protein (DUF2235 family)
MALYAFDGTWNKDQEVDERDTNVRKFFELSDEREDKKLYVAGIGTRFGFLGRVVGGGFGAGGRNRVNAAYDHLQDTWRPGEPIDVVGFSRGSAVALDFVNRIAERRHERGAPQPPIRFMGLFDTVAAFGLPNVGLVEEIDLNIGHDLRLPRGGVQHCFHALALDECREAFGVTRLNGAHEVWFRGCHSDVGGGNGNTKLSMVALRWMLRKAALCGVPINQTRLAAVGLERGIDSSAPVKLPRDFIRDEFRSCSSQDRVHYTVGRVDGRADRDVCNPFPFTLVETEADEASLAPRV